jgi:outer membrane protein assembly factor BamD (BamD/ComL family)
LNAKKLSRNALLLLLWLGALQAQQQRPSTQMRDLYLRAQELESFNRFDQAAELYQRLCEANPADLLAYAGARRCLLQLHRYAQLEQLILRLQQSYRHLQFEADLAELFYLQGQKERALQRWSDIVDANPLSEEAYQLVGGALEGYELWPEALSVYQKGRKRLKRPQAFALEISRIQYHEQHYDESSEELLVLLKSAPEQFGMVQAQFLNFMSEQPAFAAMTRAIERAIKADRSLAISGYQILGAACTQAKKYDTALSHYIQLETLTKSGEMAALPGHFIFALGMTALNDHSYVEARAAFTRIVEQYPASPYRRRAELALAEIYEQRKEFPQAILAYQQFVGRYERAAETWSALMKIGDIQFIGLFDLDAAEKTYQKIADDRSASGYRWNAGLRLGDVAIAAGNLDRAKVCYERVAKEAPENAEVSKEASLGLAQVAYYGGRTTVALAVLARLLYAKPTSPPNKIENDALELYLLLSENKNDSLAVGQLGEAAFKMAQHQYAAAAERLLGIRGKLQAEARMLLIAAYRKLGQAGRALSYCDSLQQNEEAPLADRALMLEAELYLHDLADPALARKKYETLLEKFPQSVYIEEARTRVRELDKKLKSR